MRRRWWEQVDWPGAIAFTMAAGISLGFASALIMSASSRTPPINETTATLLATLGGAMIGAVATYLGASHNGRSTMTTHDPNPPAPEPEPEPEPGEPDTDGGERPDPAGPGSDEHLSPETRERLRRESEESGESEPGIESERPPQP